MKNQIIILMGLAAVLSSCASLNSQPKIQKKVIIEKSLTAIETSEGNHVVYIHAGNDKEIFCAYRGNDFAFTQSGGVSLSTKQATTSMGISANTSGGVAELGGVNSGVLLSREIMYRTCEFMANLKALNGLTPDDAKQIFQKSLDVVLKIATDYEASPETEQTTEPAPIVN